MEMAGQKRILLVIGGGIAAYKCLELIRRLGDRGATVRCVLTKAGAEFVTPLSALAAASGAAVTIDENCNDDANPTIPFPDVSASIPAEDMNLGGRG